MTRISHQIGIAISSKSDDAYSAFQRDISNPVLRVINDRYSDFQVGSVTVPADGTPVSLSFGDMLDVRGYYLELVGAGGIKLWVNQPGPITPTSAGALVFKSPGTVGSATQLPIHCYQDACVSSLVVSATDNQALVGAYALWGFAQVTPS